MPWFMVDFIRIMSGSCALCFIHSRDELWYASGFSDTSSIFGQPDSLQPAMGSLLIFSGDGICRACFCELQGES